MGGKGKSVEKMCRQLGRQGGGYLVVCTYAKFLQTDSYPFDAV